MPLIRLALISLGLVVSLWACQSQQAQPSAVQTATETAPSPAPAPSVDTVSPYANLLNKAFVTGQFNPATHPDFTRIEAQYTDKEEVYLHKDAYAAFLKMHAAAKKDGIKLLIRSAARNFNYQKSIWEAKWKGTRKVGGEDLSKTIPAAKPRALKILEFSSMPGTSRHHWGTDIDFNSFENSYFTKGKGLQEYQWLSQHAGSYGFCQVYTEKGENRPNGYNLEKWHWSYLPIAQELTKFAAQHLKDQDIQGFAGAEAAPSIGVVERYILGIDPSCQ